MKRILLSLGLSLLGVYGMAQLSGTYTVDPGSPASATNYQAIDDAWDDLINSGVNGPVIINVAEGTYTEQLYANYDDISGTSSTNTVTIQSDPNNSNMPILQWSSYPVYWNWSDINHVTIKGLNIKTTGFSRVVYIYYGTTDGTGFEDCVFDGTNTTSTSNFYSIVYWYRTSMGTNGFFLKNNEFNEGSYGLYTYYNQGSGTLVVDSNVFNSISYCGVYQYYMYDGGVSITGNDIEVEGGTSTCYGIYSYYPRNECHIDGNNVFADNNSFSTFSYKYGMYIRYFGSGNSSSNRSTIRNNMVISGDGSSSDNTVYLYYTHRTDVVNNSLLCRSTNSGADAMAYYNYNSSTFDDNKLQNNIFATESTLPYNLYLIVYNDMEISHNMFWNGSALKVYWNLGAGTSISYNLTQLEQNTGTPGNISVDPNFNSNLDLHLFNASVDGAGANVGLDHDIDGDFRVVSSPDVGADEFGVDNNAQPTAMLSPNKPVCADDTCLNVVVTNTGNLNLTSVEVNWGINSSSNTVNWTGNLAQGQSDTLNLICNLSIQDGDSFWIYTAEPNGQYDSLNLNDTLSQVFYIGLAGTYAIPGDFPSPTVAANEASDRGVCAACIMDIAPGSYTGDLTLRDVTGTDSVKTVTWRSSTGNAEDVTIDFAGTSISPSVVRLIDADWQIFEDLTVHNNQTSAFGYGKTFEFSGGSDNNTVQRSNLISQPTTTTSTNMTNVHLSGVNMNTVIDDNWIYGGSYGIRAEAGGGDYNTTITNNSIEDWAYMGIYNYYYGGSNITDNVVVNDTTLGYNFGGYGIYAYYSDGTDVERNMVASTQTQNGLSYGIYYYQVSGTATNRASLSNNCVSTGKIGSASYGYYGVYVYGGWIDIEGNTINRLGGSTNAQYSPLTLGGGGSIKMYNNNLRNFTSSYAMYASNPFYMIEMDNNNYYTEGSSLIYNGNAYSTVEDWYAGTGFDQNGKNVDPMYADTIACATCSEDLDGAGTAWASHADLDVNGDMRSSNTPDIGAVEFVIASNFTLGGDSTYCADEVLVEAGPGNVTWSVNGSSVTSSSLLLQAGTEAEDFNILVSIESPYCGSANDNAVITLVPNANLDSNTHICVDEVVTLDPGGLSTGAYTWSTGAGTKTIQVDEPGTYSVTKLVLGCESSASTMVTQSDDIEFATTEVCSDDLPLALDATINDGISYAWTGGASPTTSLNTFNDGGPYSVTATDAFGCSTVENFVVNVLEEPEAAITIPNSSGNIYVFDASTSNYLTNNSTVNWNFGAGATPATSTNVSEMVTYPWSNPASPASYNVSLEINNGCGINIATMTVTPDPLGVEDLAKGEFAIYPNPANDVVTVTTKETGAGNIQILDMSGRTIVEVPVSAGSNNHMVDVSKLSAGTYMVRVTNEQSTEMKQLIIQ